MDLLVNEADYLLDRLLRGRRGRIPHDEARLRALEQRQIHFAARLAIARHETVEVGARMHNVVFALHV